MTELIVAGMALVGTLVGTFGGILASSRLTNYKIEQLTKKVEAHNCLIDRMYAVERKLDVDDHRIKQLEEAVQ